MENNVALIIPMYCQTQHLDRILSGIKKQTVKPAVVFVMIDRPFEDENWMTKITQSDVEKMHSGNPFELKIIECRAPPIYVGNYPEKGKKMFLAPHIRNLGITNAIEFGCDNFIFIDGDCIPQPTLVESHIKKLNYNLPILTAGRRRELKYRWQDQRESDAGICHLDLFRKNGTVINNPDLLKRSLIVWSCNIGMNMAAVNLIKKFNRRYYTRDEVFSSEFNGKWGGEDGFLGVEAWHCRIFITTLGEKGSGVEHIDHPRPGEKYTIKHREFFEKQLEKLRGKVKINPLGLKFFNA